jgi:uncharacterized protein
LELNDMPLAYGLIHPVDLALQDLPPMLQGLKIAHLSDLHITRPRPRFDRLVSQLASLRLDMAVFTGDYMMRDSDGVHCAQVLKRIVNAVRPRLGAFGVFGNHDSAELAGRVKDIGIHWLGTGVHQMPDSPIQLLGIDPIGDDADDGAAMLLNGDPLQPGQLRLMLAHYPSWISTAADLGVDIMFAGHTHGGQVRLPGGHALVNSCDLPLKMSSGLLRHRDTLVAISRGLGEVGLPGLRLRAFCPPHVPVYTLRRGPTLGRNTPDVVRVMRW